jgi:hypothetical protein
VSSCSGPGGVDILTPSGSIIGGWGDCVSLRAPGAPVAHTQDNGEPLRLSLQTSPSTSWRILIYEINDGS